MPGLPELIVLHSSLHFGLLPCHEVTPYGEKSLWHGSELTARNSAGNAEALVKRGQ